MGLSLTVSEINGDFSLKLQNWQSACAVPSNPVSGGCKMITYLESHTPSFLLTVQLSSGYDADLRAVYSRALPLSVFRPKKSTRVTGSPSR